MAYVRPDGGMSGVNDEPYVYDPSLSGGGFSYDPYGYGDGIEGLFGKKGFFSRVGKGIGRVAKKTVKIGGKLAPYAVGGVVGGTLLKKGFKVLKKKKKKGKKVSIGGVVSQAAGAFPSPPNAPGGTMVAQDILPTQQAPGSFNGGGGGFGPGQSAGGITDAAGGQEAPMAEAGMMGGLSPAVLVGGAVVIGLVMMLSSKRR